MSDIVIHGLENIRDKTTLNLYPNGKVYNVSPFGKDGLSYVELSTLKNNMINEVYDLVCKDCNSDCDSCKFSQAMNFLSKYNFKY